MIDPLQTLLAVAPPTEEGAPSLFMTFLPMIMIFVVFYFLMIAPARRKQKKHAEMLQNLKNGDRVITNGGIHATVVGVTDNVVQLRVADKVKIDVSRQAIAALQSPTDE
ncbi:MAG TPA: preprotein translocase subunit YajC [Candidatus Polarisedimenticolaceae bacterium]|nr:preprotein translocase subunit YajC [Candidatus Polarisedimenticolaceae bacterium]